MGKKILKGYIQLPEDYVPEEENDIVTKKYVDENGGGVSVKIISNWMTIDEFNSLTNSGQISVSDVNDITDSEYDAITTAMNVPNSGKGIFYKLFPIFTSGVDVIIFQFKDGSDRYSVIAEKSNEVHNNGTSIYQYTFENNSVLKKLNFSFAINETENKVMFNTTQSVNKTDKDQIVSLNRRVNDLSNMVLQTIVAEAEEEYEDVSEMSVPSMVEIDSNDYSVIDNSRVYLEEVRGNTEKAELCNSVSIKGASASSDEGIKSVDVSECDVFNGNFIKLDDVSSTTMNGITYKISNGIITLNGTPTENTTLHLRINEFKLEQNQAYNFKEFVNLKQTYGVDTYIRYYNTTNSAYETINASSTNDTYNFNGNGYVADRVSFYFRIGYTYSNLQVKPMLVKGNVAPTQFVAGKYDTLEFPSLELNGAGEKKDELIIKGDNLQEANVLRRCIKYDLKNIEWKKSGSHSVYYCNTLAYHSVPGQRFNIISSTNRFNIYDTESNRLYVNDYGQIVIDNPYDNNGNVIDNLADFNSLIQSLDSFNVVVPLETPTIEAITPTKALTTLSKSEVKNAISNNSNSLYVNSTDEVNLGVLESSDVNGVEFDGENLIGFDDVSSTTMNGVTYSIKDGIIKLNGTATANVNINLTTNMGLNNQSYTISNFALTTSAVYYLRVFDNQDNQVCFLSNGTNTRNFTSSIKNIDMIIDGSTGISFNNYVIKPMLVRGNTAPTQFKPYTPPQTISIPLTTLRGINKQVQDEIQFVQNENDLFDMVLVRKCGEYVFNGSETIELYDGRYIFRGIVGIVKKPENTSLVANIISNLFTTISSNNLFAGQNGISIDNNENVLIRQDNISSIEEMKNYISNSTLIYELATPTENVLQQNLSLEQVSAIMQQGGTIKLIGSNSVDLKLKMTIRYYRTN